LIVTLWIAPMFRFLVVALPLLLTACNASTGGQTGLTAGYDPDVDGKVRQLRIVAGQFCKTQGFRPDTAPFEECVYNYGREKIAEAELSLASSGAIASPSPTYSAPPVIYAPASRPPVTCRTMPTSAND
jgi:hypothetical protein